VKEQIIAFLREKGEANRAEILEHLNLYSGFKISHMLGKLCHADRILERTKKKKPGVNLEVYYFRIRMVK